MKSSKLTLIVFIVLVFFLVATIVVNARNVLQSDDPCQGSVPGQGPLPDRASVMAVANRSACLYTQKGGVEPVLLSVKVVNGQEYQELLSEKGIVNPEDLLPEVDLIEPELWVVSFQGEFTAKRTSPDGTPIIGRVLTLTFDARNGDVISFGLAP